MNFLRFFRYENFLHRCHGWAYVCARLSVFLVLLLALRCAYASLVALSEFVLAAAPNKSLVPHDERSGMLLQHVLFASLAMGAAWMAVGLWRFDRGARDITCILSALTLFSVGRPYSTLCAVLFAFLIFADRLFDREASRKRK